MIRIGAWRVDPRREQISKDGATIKLERRAMQLLLCLAEQPGRILSVEELLDRVWAGVVVTPDSVYQAVASLRRILGDDSKEPIYITNTPRRGYSLVAPVGPWVDDPLETQGASGAAAVEKSAAPVSAGKGRSSLWWVATTSCAALGLALAVFAIEKGWRPVKAVAEKPQPVPAVQRAHPAASTFPAKSIAVLPFVDLSEKTTSNILLMGWQRRS